MSVAFHSSPASRPPGLRSARNTAPLAATYASDSRAFPASSALLRRLGRPNIPQGVKPPAVAGVEIQRVATHPQDPRRLTQGEQYIASNAKKIVEQMDILEQGEKKGQEDLAARFKALRAQRRLPREQERAEARERASRDTNPAARAAREAQEAEIQRQINAGGRFPGEAPAAPAAPGAGPPGPGAPAAPPAPGAGPPGPAGNPRAAARRAAPPPPPPRSSTSSASSSSPSGPPPPPPRSGTPPRTPSPAPPSPPRPGPGADPQVIQGQVSVERSGPSAQSADPQISAGGSSPVASPPEKGEKAENHLNAEFLHSSDASLPKQADRRDAAFRLYSSRADEVPVVTQIANSTGLASRPPGLYHSTHGKAVRPWYIVQETADGIKEVYQAPAEAVKALDKAFKNTPRKQGPPEKSPGKSPGSGKRRGRR